MPVLLCSLNRFYVVATDILTRTDALIDKLVGDQISGFYIPGFAGAGHARKALQAGEELLRATGHESPGGPWIPVGVGMYTGIAFVGAVDADDGVRNVTALDDAVNVAARLSSLAQPGEMLISESAARAAGKDEESSLPLRYPKQPNRGAAATSWNCSSNRTK